MPRTAKTRRLTALAIKKYADSDLMGRRTTKPLSGRR
jgi:hypothetical protein